MMNATLRGKPDAGNPHVRFDEGEVASENPRRGSLLYSKDIDGKRGWTPTRKAVAPFLVGALALGLTAFGEGLTVPCGTGTNLTASASFDGMTVKGPLVIDGGGAVFAVTNTGTTAIGPDAGDDASVTITNGAYLIVKGGGDITYGANGGSGGKISVSNDTSFVEGWGSRSGETLKGTFGGRSVHRISSLLTSARNVFDLVEMGPKGYFGFSQIATENTNVKTRLLFNGGVVWVCNQYAGTLFNAVAGSEIVLEGVGNNTIAFRGMYGTHSFMCGDGHVTVKGKGALEYQITNAPELSVLKLGGGINWENDGGLIISSGNSGGNFTVKTTSHNVLPYAKGGVTISRGRGNYKDTDFCMNALDLNGTTQKIHSLTMAQYAHVTNSSSRRAVLEIGECATSTLTLSGIIGGPIDVIVKSTYVELHKTNGLELVGGAQLTFAPISNPTFGNVKSDGFDYSGTVTVSNWTHGVSQDPSFVKTGAKRDLPVSLVKRVGITPGTTVDVKNGALAVADFSGAGGGLLHIRTNAAFRVQSQGGLHYRFIRFVIKESIGASLFPGMMLYPNLRAICLVDETGANYWPVDQGFACQSADTALGDMPAGSYKFHSDKAASGNGSDLDTVNVPNVWPVSSLRSSDYNFNREKLLSSGNNWGGLLITNSVPRRADSSSWHVITLRMKDDDAKMSGYWFSSNWNCHSYPGCWAVEASDDGTTWVTLDEKVDYYAFGFYNHQNNPLYEGYQIWNTDAKFSKTVLPFLWTTNIAPNSVSFALNGAKVRVDRGGVLDVTQTGAPAEIGWLEADARTGCGYLSSFKPLANGVLNLVNVQESGTLQRSERQIALTYGSIVSPENLETWKVCVNGEEVSGARVKLTEGGLKISIGGMVLLLR